MAARVAWPLALALGCQPGPVELAGESPCGRPPTSGVAARPVRCSDDVPPGGEGRVGDTWLASSTVRAVIAHPQGAHTVAGLPGGTLIDVAPWGHPDSTREWIPLVQGGWLDVHTVEAVEGGVRITGPVISLPGRPPRPVGRDATVTWRLDPDAPWVIAEGADALLLHVAGPATLEDQQIVSAGLTHHWPGAAEDLGGWIRVDADRVLVAPAADALAWRWPSGPPLSVTSIQGTRLELLEDGEVRHTLPFDDGEITTRRPPGIDQVRVVTPGRAPTAATPAANLALEPGPAGTIDLFARWQGRAHPIGVTWRTGSITGRQVLPAEGGMVPTGPGSVRLEIEGQRLEVRVDEGATVDVDVDLQGHATARQRVAVLRGDADQATRSGDAGILAEAAAAGLDAVIVTALRDVPDLRGVHISPRVVLTGTTVTDRSQAQWTGWPWSPSSRRSGHGAPATHTLDGADTLGRLSGADQAVIASLSAIERLPAAWRLEPPPSHVMLDHPGDLAPLEAWAAWFELLDAGALVWPAGPEWRVAVPDVDNIGAIDIEAGLLRGTLVATSGPEPWLTVDGAGPGELAHAARPGPTGPPSPRALLELDQVPDEAQVELIFSNGHAGPWTAATAPEGVWCPPDARWVVLAVWTDTTWAATAPILLAAP